MEHKTLQQWRNKEFINSSRETRKLALLQELYQIILAETKNDYFLATKIVNLFGAILLDTKVVWWVGSPELDFMEKLFPDGHRIWHYIMRCNSDKLSTCTLAK